MARHTAHESFCHVVHYADTHYFFLPSYIVPHIFIGTELGSRIYGNWTSFPVWAVATGHTR